MVCNIYNIVLNKNNRKCEFNSFCFQLCRHNPGGNRDKKNKGLVTTLRRQREYYRESNTI